MKKIILALVLAMVTTIAGACGTVRQRDSSSSSSTGSSITDTGSSNSSSEGNSSSGNGSSNSSEPGDSGDVSTEATVTFINGNGDEIYHVTVEKGTTIRYLGSTPTKAPQHEHHHYEFAGWLTDGISEPIMILPSVENDVVYTAAFNEIIKQYSVSFKYEDGTSITSYTLPYGSPITIPEPTKVDNNGKYKYTFSHWEVDGVETTPTATVQKNVTYTAKFDEVINTYTVVWYDANGDEIERDENVAHGEKPQFNLSEPTKPSEGGKAYQFVGWATIPNADMAEGLVEVTRNLNLYPVFTTNTETYTVTWKVEGVVVEIDNNVLYGTPPSYDGPTPTKAGNAQFSYEFDCWSPDSNRGVTEDVTFVAQFKEITESYDVTWVNGDGEILKTEQVAYGETPSYSGDIPTKNKTPQFTFTFNNTWSPEITSVKGDVIYTAQFNFTVNKYWITWKNYDGSLLDSQEMEYGQPITYPNSQSPIRPDTDQYSYEFAGWTPSIDGATVTDNATFTATYTEVTKVYTINWVDEEGNQLAAPSKLEYGAEINAPTVSKDKTAEYSYTFKAWTLNGEKIEAFGTVKENVTYVASFTATKNKYTVKWFKEDGKTLITEQQVEYGETPKYEGLKPTKDITAQYQYEFVGWTPEIVAVTDDAEYTAKFEATLRKYEVTFYNWNETDFIASINNVEYGTTGLKYTGDIPTRPDSDGYSYTFSGWKVSGDTSGKIYASDALPEINGKTTFIAQYTSTIKTYTVTWKNGTSTVHTETVEHGKKPTAYPTSPSTWQDATTVYTFKCWTVGATEYAVGDTLPDVTGNLTFNAKFDTQARKYAISWSVNGVIVAKTDVAYNTIPEYTPDYVEGYEFLGWSNKEVTFGQGTSTEVTGTSKVSGSATYYGVYTNISVWDGTIPNITSYTFNGSGTSASDPYQIRSATDLAALSAITKDLSANFGSGKYYKLMMDIDLREGGWQPICYTSVWKNEGEFKAFSGTFIGNNKTILLQETEAKSHFGLFTALSGTVSDLTLGKQSAGYTVTSTNGFIATLASRVTSTATVKNVINYTNLSVTLNYDYAYATGGLVAVAEGVTSGNGAKFINCQNYGNVTVNGAKQAVSVGGIIGKAGNGISLSENVGNYGKITVTGTASTAVVKNVAGIIGEAGNVSLTNVTNGGEVKATTATGASAVESVAGLIGFLNEGVTITVSQCKNTASVTGQSGVAGIVAGGYATVTYNGCTNEGNISGTDTVGGIASYAKANLTSCINSGNVSGSNAVGGIVAKVFDNETITITDCDNLGNVTGQSGVAGIVAGGYATVTYNGCTNEGNISGTDNVGGIASYLWGSLTSCSSKGTITGTTNVGGLVGNDQSGLVFKSTSAVTLGKTGTTIGKCVGNWAVPFPTLTDKTEKDLFAGSGSSASDPYLINNEYDLAILSAFTAKKDYGSSSIYYKLTADLDLTKIIWQPICYTGQDEGNVTKYYSFMANLDGNSKSITYNCNQNGLGFGLFAGVGGYVHHLTVNGTLNTYGTGGGLTAIVFNGAKIENVTSNVAITKTSTGGSGYNLGGIVGRLDTVATTMSVTISNCVNNGAITGTGCLGGILGSAVVNDKATSTAYFASISGCTNKGAITGNDELGGIVGLAIRVSIDNCNNNSQIGTSGTSTKAGGILGNVSSTSTIASIAVSSSNNSGKVVGTNWLGGIIGNANAEKTTTAYNIKVTNCNNNSNGAVTGKEGLGGIVGSANRVEISGCKNYASIGTNNTSTHAGGIVGYLLANSKITSSSNEAGVVQGNYELGGIVGYVADNCIIGNTASTTYTDVVNKANVTGNYTLGGIFGNINGTATNIQITSVTNEGTITGQKSGSNSYLGGIQGGGHGAVTFKYCKNNGNVSGTGDLVGGIASQVFVVNGKTTILLNCENYGEISGENTVGGIVGSSSSTNVTQCYNYGKVSGTSIIGGIAGKLEENATLSSCDNNGEISATTVVGGIVGLMGAGASLTTVNNSANVTATNTSDFSSVAGIVGQVVSGAVSITGATNKSTATISGTKGVAGIVGGGYAKVTFTNCINEGTVTGTTIVGGIAAYLWTSLGASHTGCSNGGTVTGATADIGSGSSSIGKLFGQES